MNEADPLDISGDVAAHPPVDHPGRVAGEQKRAANQTQGGPAAAASARLSGGPQVPGGQEKPSHARQDGQDGAKQGPDGPQDRTEQFKTVARPVANVATFFGFGPSPKVLRWLSDNPAYGDNPFAPINMDDPTMTWQRMVLVGRRWNAFMNPKNVSATVNDILNEHTAQGEIKRALLDIPDSPDGQWAWREILPQLAVAAADGNPVTGAVSLAGEAPEDPRKALQAAWSALPWEDYWNIAQLLVTHPDQVSLPMVGSMYWKQLTAALTIGSLLPEVGFFGKLAGGSGRMAFAFPGRKYVEDAVKAVRRLPSNPDVPPPDALAELARGVQALTPTVVRKGRTADQAAAAAARMAAHEAPLVDLGSHLREIHANLAGAGPSQDRAGELLQRLQLLNIDDPTVKQAGQAFQTLRKGDFASFAEFSAARQRRWDDLLTAVERADASKVKLPAALDFLAASDLATLPTETMHELMQLSYEETAAKAVYESQVAQLERAQRLGMRRLYTGLFGRDELRRLEAQKIRPTEKLAQQLLPHMAPKMTAPQQAFLRAMWNKFAGYDLRRLQPEDVTPRQLNEYLGEVGTAARPAAAQFIGSTYGILAFVQGGPHFLEDNPIEALTQSLLSRNRAEEAMLGEFFFPQMAALAEHGKVDMVEAMRALRDDAAFDRLPAEGKLIVDAWRHVQLLLRDRAMATGFRSDFVGRFDPRVPVRIAEEDPEAQTLPRRLAGGSVISGTSKAHRIEHVMQDPQDPSRVAIGEKYRDVFKLNDAMAAAQADHIAQAVAKGQTEVQAAIEAKKLYPQYHENLAFAAYEYLGKELRALNAHQAVQTLQHAWTPEGTRLAYEATDRTAPEGYRPLEKASRSYQNVLFHPQFADAIDKANRSIAPLDMGALERLAKVGGGAKSAIMFSPMIHAWNVVGRVLPMLLTHPWAAFDELAGPVPKELQALDPQTRRMYRVMEAMQNGVVPHKAAREFFNNTMTALGNATGDSRSFEVPAGAELKDAGQFIQQRARQMPGLVGRITPVPLQQLTDWFWRQVFAFQVLAYHVEQRGLAKRFPNLDPARVNMYAAFRANRWGGAIEPENWSQFGYQASRLLMFAPNWLRSFLELQAPIYLRGELGASKELQQYVWEQEMRSVAAMLAGQQITGNALNLLLSGHTTYQNQPQNRNRVEIDPSNPDSPGRVAYDALYAIDPAMVKGIDPNTGRNPKTGAVLTWENPFGRQQAQLEEASGLPSSPFTTGDQDQPAAIDTFAAAHVSPIVQALAMAANVDLYNTARSGFTSAQLVDPTGWNPSVLLPALLQLTPLGSAAQQALADQGGQAQQPQPGQSQGWQDQYRAWAQGLPLPPGLRDMVAAAPDSALKTVITNALGLNSPYEKAETSKGTRLDSVHDARLKQILDEHHKIMASQSQDLLSGKVTPYNWRQWYQSYTPNYDGQLQAYFQGTPAYTSGSAGLYEAYQGLYNEALLPDGSGVDWAKLNQLQADFRSKHTDAEMSAMTAYQSQQEHSYPALQMYREVMDDHRQQQQTWARQMGMTDSQLLTMVKGYGEVAGDRHASGVYLAQHPQMAAYLRLNEEWQVDNPYGQMYSLYYHTSAMRKWLAGSGETEAQGAHQLEQEWHP